MNDAVQTQNVSSASAAPFARSGFSTRWYGRIGLLLISTALLTASFAPVNQFYLSWIGLVPWLIVLSTTRSQKSAFFWSWLAGTFFFIANMWWMYSVTSYGMVALMAILGLYWGYAGIIIRGAGLLGTTLDPRSSTIHPRSSILHARSSPTLRMLLIAAIWVAASEWFRGTWPWHGLPWLYLGSTQTPALWMCQIADITGVGGLSFLIAAINAWVAIWFTSRCRLKGLVPSGITWITLLISVIVYGAYRMHSEPALLTPGPVVMVVQANFPQDNTGQKGATPQELVDFHFGVTNDALHEHPEVELSVWSETMMPPLNAEAWERRPDLKEIGHELSYLTRQTHSAILTGSEYAVIRPGEKHVERRNSAYFYDHRGTQYHQRYDKIHLVPYGEFTPFKDSVPWLYKLAVHFGPPDMEAYMLAPGSEQQLTLFPLEQRKGKSHWMFVTPICFEDIDSDICADMFRPEPATPNVKRADFLVNITNDGWFKANENSQHLQAAIFRSIENRASTARSVNTGISGFIDPLGHAYGLIPERQEGTSVQQLKIDPRVTIFTRVGPLFSWLCAGITVVLIIASMIFWIRNLMTRR